MLMLWKRSTANAARHFRRRFWCASTGCWRPFDFGLRALSITRSLFEKDTTLQAAGDTMRIHESAWKYGMKDSRLDKLKEVMQTDGDETRRILSDLEIPGEDSAKWVRAFLELPWTFQGENYLSFPIGLAVHGWILAGNADQLTGTHFVNFCRAFEHAVNASKLKDFLFAVLSPHLIRTTFPESMAHLLRFLLLCSEGEGVPQGLKMGIQKHLTLLWYGFHFVDGWVAEKQCVNRLYSYAGCFQNAIALGVPVRDIIELDLVMTAKFVNLCHAEVMALLDFYLLEVNTRFSLSLSASMEFQKKALRSVALRENFCEPTFEMIARNSIRKKEFPALGPSMAEFLLEILNSTLREGNDTAFNTLLSAIRGMLVEILTVHHMRYKFRIIFPDDGTRPLGSKSFTDFLINAMHNGLEKYALYPMLRIFSHHCFALHHRGRKSFEKYDKVLKHIAQTLLILTDGKLILNLSNQSTASQHQCATEVPNDSLRHIHANNPKAFSLLIGSKSIKKSPYLSWLSIEHQLALLKCCRATFFNSSSLFSTLTHCASNLQHLPCSFASFAWPLYLLLQMNAQTQILHNTHESTLQTLASALTSSICPLDEAQLLRLVRDTARAGIWDDSVSCALRSALQAFPLKSVTRETIWKYCLLHIHALEEGRKIDLPKSYLFSVFNYWYGALQKRDQISSYAPFLPELVLLVSRLKINAQTLTKLTEVCHIMLHYTNGCARVSVAVLGVYTRQILPPTSSSSYEDITAGRILPKNQSLASTGTWLDPVQVGRFIERYVKFLHVIKEGEHKAVHLRSEVLTAFELCIAIRHNSPAIDALIDFGLKLNCPIVSIEICRISFAFNKPISPSVAAALSDTIGSPFLSHDSLDTWPSASSARITIKSLVPLLSSFSRHGAVRHQALLTKTVQHIQKLIDSATSNEVRFLLDQFRTEGSVIEPLIDRSTFAKMQTSLIKEVYKRTNNDTATIEMVLDVILWNIGTTETSYDAEIHRCLSYVSAFLEKEPKATASGHIVTILQMMARSGWRYDRILRRTLPLFLETPVKNVYDVTAVLSALRKIEIHELFTRTECIALITALCAKLEPMTALSSRLVGSILTSLSVLIQAAIGSTPEIQASIERLFGHYTVIIHNEVHSMDCITLSAILVACTRLGLSHHREVIDVLLERSTELPWAKFPTQTVHLLHATAQIRPEHDILLYLMFAEELAFAIRCIIDQASSYKNLHDATHQIMNANPGVSFQDSPVAALVFERIPEPAISAETSIGDPIDGDQ